MIGACINDDYHTYAMQEVLQRCGVLVKSMSRAEADAALQGPLMPALVKAFQHSSADVRKAVSAPVLTVMITPLHLYSRSGYTGTVSELFSLTSFPAHFRSHTDCQCFQLYLIVPSVHDLSW